MLGDALYNTLSKNHNVDGCDLVELDHSIDIIDVTNFDRLKMLLLQKEIDVLIHTVAMINVDGCEENPDMAFKLNSEVTRELANFCKNKKIKMVYISTDAVFSGNKSGVYDEDDIVDPINVYGASKLRGEEYIAEYLDDYLILRTNIYGWNKQDKISFAEWVYNSLLASEEIKMFNDVYYTPIYIGNFAEALNEMLDKDLSGLFNIVGAQHCSKYDFGVSLCKVFGFDSNLIKKISVDSFSFKAQRSKNMRLDNRKLKQKIETKLLSVDEGLELFFKERLINEE